MHFWFVIVIFFIKNWNCKMFAGWQKRYILHNPADFYWQINRYIWVQAKWRKRIHCSFKYTVLQTFLTIQSWFMPNFFFKSIKNSIPSHALYETHYSFYWPISTKMTRRATDCKIILFKVKMNGISRSLDPNNWKVPFREMWFLERWLEIVGWNRGRLKSELAYMPLADILPLEKIGEGNFSSL